MRKGFTLLETIFAVAVFSLVMGMTLGSWLLFMYKSTGQQPRRRWIWMCAR